MSRGVSLALALSLAISAWSPTAGASDSTTACDGIPAGDVCSQGPTVPVDGVPIDRDQWVPRDFPTFPDVGFNDDAGGYIPDGYGGGAEQQLACSAWEEQYANRPPAECSASAPPLPVTPSNPPCGPDDSWITQYLPQTVASACVAHDVCYSQLNADKDRCDAAFRDNMRVVCEQNPLWWMNLVEFEYCLLQTQTYGYAVRLYWADTRFQSLQTEAECRQWHERRENESDCS